MKYICANSQLNYDVNSKVNFQKTRIPLFMLYSKFLCGSQKNQQLQLPDFAEV